MKIKYQTTFGGYMTVLRATLYLIKTKTLSFAEFGAYMALLSQADYDKRHKYYGVIIRDDYEIARELSCDPTTIYNHRKSLIKKGLFVEEDGLTKVPNFFAFELEWTKTLAKIPSAILQELFVKPQNGIDQLQEVIGKTQELLLQNKPQSFNTSSKGELNVSQDNTEYIDVDEVAKAIDENLSKTEDNSC